MSSTPSRLSRPAYLVLDLCCGNSPLPASLARQRPRRRVFYTGVDENRESRPSAAPSGSRVTSRVIVRKLHFDNPLVFGRQLRGIAGGRKFDEIHLHLSTGVTRANLNAADALWALSNYLAPGGRFYHFFKYWSPVVGADLDPQKLNDSRPQVHRRNSRKLAALARASGLRLERYGFKPRDEGAWMLGPRPAPTRFLEAFRRAGEGKSNWSHAANHFVLMRKPAESATNRR